MIVAPSFDIYRGINKFIHSGYSHIHFSVFLFWFMIFRSCYLHNLYEKNRSFKNNNASFLTWPIPFSSTFLKIQLFDKNINLYSPSKRKKLFYQRIVRLGFVTEVDSPTSLVDCRLKDQRSVTGPFLSGARLTGDTRGRGGSRREGWRRKIGSSRRRSTLRNHGL